MVDINFNRLKEAKNDNEVYEIFKEERSKYFDNLKGEKGAQGRYFANQIEKLISVYNDYYEKYPVPIAYWDGEERQDDSMFQALNCWTSDFVFSHISIDLDPIHIMAYLKPFRFSIDPQSKHYDYGIDKLHSMLLCVSKFRKALEEKNGNKVKSEISKSVEEKGDSNESFKESVLEILQSLLLDADKLNDIEGREWAKKPQLLADFLEIISVKSFSQSTDPVKPHQKKTRKRNTNSYLHDERALKVYKRAIKAGYMKEIENNKTYAWDRDMKKGLCAYMIECLCVSSSKDPMPYKEAGGMFGVNIRGLKQSYDRTRIGKPKGFEDIDKLFEDL